MHFAEVVIGKVQRIGVREIQVLFRIVRTSD